MICTEYRIPAGRELTVALAADLHERCPEELLQLLRQAQPDILCVAGDTFERYGKGEQPGRPSKTTPVRRFLHRVVNRCNSFAYRKMPRRFQPETEHAYRFLREASALRSRDGKPVPVFLSLGNHEWELKPEDREVIRESGTILLDNADTVWNGIRIGGLSSVPDPVWLQGFAAQPGCKFLLCHHPDYYERYLKNTDIDLILSGHMHGGQVRIFGRGVFSPTFGFFPEYCRGIYDGRLVVSAGCSNTTVLPRWGNPTELVILHLTTDTEGNDL